MKTLSFVVRGLTLGGLLAGAAACQQAAVSSTAPNGPETAAVPEPVVPVEPQESEEFPADPVMLAQDAREFMAHYDLSELLQMEGNSSYELMNGFFGPDHYRIEFAMLEVKPDTARPGHFWVTGKNRFKKQITPFTGEITLTSLNNQPPYKPARGGKISAGEQEGITAINRENMYCAQGTFRLQEDSQAPGAGTFTGKAVLDFEVDEKGSLNVSSRNKEFGARNGGVLLEGTWTSLDGRRRKQLTLVRDIFYFNQHIFTNFTIGERDPDFNPRYAKLGWNTYWENSEWWAEPGPRKTPEETPAEISAEVADSTLGL